MPLTGDELVCPKFQPNIFDSTRCHDCLRQKHLHNSSPEHDTTAAHTQEKDTSTKEDSDVLSVVSSYCDVSRGGRGFEDGSLCMLSADCDLYVCDGDDDQSSDSQCDDSVYSSSVSVEEDTNILHYPSSHCRMTRLDLSSHRSNPRGWTEVGHGRDAFGSFGFSHGGVQEKRDRESGYFSLGRASGSRAVCDKGSPPPYRHSERGHPIPGNKSPEPKATIPFRNPDLGVPSERRTSEIQNPELTDCPPQHVTPDPVDLSVEVEALAGPRSLSPTPFKQAESLSPSKRRVERNVPSSSYRQPGTLGPSQRSSSLSRSSSPGRSISPLRRGESTSSLNTLGFRAGSFAQAREQVSVSPAWNAYSGSSQKNFRSLASTVGTVSSVSKSYMDLRGTLRNSDNNSSHVGSTVNRGRSSPSRRSYDGPGQTSVRKSEMSPSSEYGHDRQSSPHAGRRYDARSQSPKGRKETDNSSGQIREGRRSASPVRKGYGTEKRSTSNGWCFNRESPPSSRKGYDTQIQPSLKKAEVKSSLHSYRRDSRHSSPSRGQHQHPDQSSLYKSKTSQVNPSRELKSRTSSPLRWGNDNPGQSLPRKSEIGQRSATLRHDPTGHAPLRNTVSDRTDSASYVKNTSKSQRESNPPLGHWRGSAHSLLSQSVSRSSSPSRNSSTQRSAPVAWETSQSVSKRSNVKQERENQSSTPNSRPSVSQKQSLAPSMQRHTSSQSSMDSESSHLSAGSSGLNREEYAVMANLPKVKTVLQREGPSHLERLKSQQRRDLSLYKPASHCQSKAPNSEWDEVEEERDAGRLSRAHSSSSLYTQRASSLSADQIHKNPSGSSEHKQKAHRPSVYFSCSVEQTDEESVQQPDLLNFKKGWMSKLDESGEWRKHWFVLTDAGLKYYRDSAAEERDEVDGEIDLKTCVKVSEFDVEKNYGFQIQTREAVFTMSAMTAGIRRNWIEVLKKSIRPNGSPDLTQLPDCSADKDNTRHTSSHRHHSQSEVSNSTNPAHCKFDYVELSRVAPTSAPTSASQRESGEGQVREHGQWQEERSRDAAHGQWEAVLSRKGAGQLTEQRRLQEEIEKKWAEFEQLPLKDMRSLPSMESRPGPLSNQALEREVASLRQQLVMLQGGREGSQVGWVGCWGAESRCIESLQQMEQVHRETLEEMEKQHTQQIRALERERDALLREETEATARVMKALQKAHKVELEKTTQHAEREGTDTQAFDKQQQAELVSLRRELEGLSERYSQKCLELNEAQQHSKERERHINLRDRQLEQLNRDNQELQVRLSEEIKVIGSVVRRQGSDADSSESSWCETQVLLRVRENELQYLHKELSCLRSQLHLLTTEKNSVCEQYREVCEELSLMKNRSESEIETLREHLRLALNALQDGQHTHNSLQH